jgi:Mn2+/Fe2+ NRAMP family transporter
MDVIVGCIMTDAIAFFIIVACAATMHLNGIRITDAKDAAIALAPLAGKHASVLFAIGLANASLFAASILPLATAYYVCEGMGWESGIDKDFRTAPQFMWLYTGIIVIGALIILIPKAPLITIMLISQVVNGIMLPFVLIFMLLLINNKDLMGEFTNSRAFDIIAWATVVIMIVLTLVLVVTSMY